MRTIRKTLTILLTVAFALVFSAVIHASGADAAGRYDAIECSKDGSYYQCDGEYLLLNEDGGGEIQFNGTVYSLKWQLDGTTLSFTDEDGEAVSGTLEDGVIHVEYLDYQYTYLLNDTSLGGSIDEGPDDAATDTSATPDEGNKDLVEVEDIQPSAADAAPGTQEGPAVYCVTDREETGSGDGEMEGHPGWRYDYIALNEDGSGVFLFNHAAYGIRWTQDGGTFSFTDHLGNRFEGTMGSGKITGVYGRYRYTFELTGNTLPAYTLLPEKWEQGLPPVVDEADVMSDAQEAELTKKAQELADKYDVGVYLVLVRSRDDYTWSNDISTLSEELRSGYSIGIGPTEKKEKHEKNTNPDWKDSILLTVAVSERKYDLCASGDYANWAFSDYGREKTRDQFLDELKGDEWADAAEEYLAGVKKVLKVAAKGKQLSFGTDTTGRMIGILAPVLLALLFGYGIAAVKRSSMQNTQKAQNAASYIASDKVTFTRREDRYIRTLVSRVYSPRQKSGSGSGGGSFSSSSGSSHTSGSF